MKIAITMSIDHEKIDKDFLYYDYTKFFEQFNCQLIYLSNFSQNYEALFDTFKIERLILSGGNDLSADFIKQNPLDIRHSSIIRDTNEQQILNIAIKRKIPVLGICRGMQFINVFFGGTITQNLPNAKDYHIGKNHIISVTDSNFEQTIGKKQFEVNSYHHQGISQEQIAKQLSISSISKKDSNVESLFHPELPIAGIQWHPERNHTIMETDNRLINAFLNKQLYWSER